MPFNSCKIVENVLIWTVRSKSVECYCIMVKIGSEEKFRDSATQLLSKEGEGSKFFFLKKR